MPDIFMTDLRRPEKKSEIVSKSMPDIFMADLRRLRE